MTTPDPDDPDECYVFEERIAILLAGEVRDATEQEIKLAVEDVERFRKERVD